MTQLKSLYNEIITTDNPSEFENKLHGILNLIEQSALNLGKDRDYLLNTKVEMFNAEKHFLRPHQVDAVIGCIDDIILKDEKPSGYCFLPTSAGKSYIIFVLAALAIGDFKLFKILDDARPDFLSKNKEAYPLLINLSMHYGKLIAQKNLNKTQIAVHDIAILDQLESEAKEALGPEITSKIVFGSIQSHLNQSRRDGLKSLIVDECHWGNASGYLTIQGSLVQHIKDNDGRAIGFTASPYENPDGTFQKTWSRNKICGDKDFNYFLDKKIIYPIQLKEVNLQNARMDYEVGDEEFDIQESASVIEFMTQNILSTIGGEIQGPSMCFFNAFIIPDIISKIKEVDKNNIIASYIKVYGSEGSGFIEKCVSLFGKEIVATEEDIQALKKGKTYFLISNQKLLVGLNAPYLRYVFISPTNSKIKILQGIGRLMRPCSDVNQKLAVLYLASLSGKKMDLGEKTGETTEKEECKTCGLKICDCPCTTCELPRNTECECPKASYVSKSMTLSEAYDLPNKVFYKDIVGFRDFINETHVHNTNMVYKIPSAKIDFKGTSPLSLIEEAQRLRSLCYAAYKNEILKRDKYHCVDCPEGVSGMGQKSLEIHHVHPYRFADLHKKLGFDGTLAWHSDPKNWKYLVTLCNDCHDERHGKHEKEDEVA